MSLSSDIKRVLEIFNASREKAPPYREFEKAPLRSPDATFDREAPGGSPETSGSVFDLRDSPGEPANMSFAPPLRSRKIFRQLEPPRVGGRTGEEWPGLKAAVADLVPALPPAPRDWPVLVLTGLAGGSGRSTLASFLAVENARQGRPCLLVDLNETSIYPYLLMTFRSEESVRTGRSWTLYTSEPAKATLIVVRPETGECGPEEDPGHLSRLREEIASQAAPLLASATPRKPLVLFDAPPLTRSRLHEVSRFASLVLSPIRPDLPSLLSVKDMEKSFDRFEQEEIRNCERYYVLNRFVPDHPLHQDIHEIFRQILARRLCPFVVPEDPSVELALAKGASLLDSFSETPAALSMADVCRWVAGKTDR